MQNGPLATLCYPLDRDNHSCLYLVTNALLPFRIAFANFYAQGLGGSRLQQWDKKVLGIYPHG